MPPLNIFLVFKNKQLGHFWELRLVLLLWHCLRESLLWAGLLHLWVLVEMEEKGVCVSDKRKIYGAFISQGLYCSFPSRLLKNSLLPTEERLHAE